MSKLKYIMAIVVLTLLSSCIHRNIKRAFHCNPVPITSVTWSDACYEKTPLKYYNGESRPNNVIPCNSTYHIVDDSYLFNVTTTTDTVTVEISQFYIGTNADSINIMINNAIDTSDIYVIYNCGWAMNGKWFCRGSTPRNDFCRVSSSKPVHVAVFVLTNWEKKNESKTIDEYKREKQLHEIDSLLHSL